MMKILLINANKFSIQETCLMKVSVCLTLSGSPAFTSRGKS